MAKKVSNVVIEVGGTDVESRRSVLLKQGTDLSFTTQQGATYPETTVALPADLTANARVAVQKAGVGPFKRRKINFIQGDNVTLTITDQPGTEQVDIQIAASAGGAGTPATSVTNETTYGITPAVGTSTNYARQDHTHGSPVTPTAASVGALAVASNLSDLASASTARTNLGLGSAAVLNAATTPAASGLLQLDAVGFFSMAAALTDWRYSFGLATFSNGVTSFVGMANPSLSGTGGTGSTYAYTNRFSTTNSGFAQNTRLIKRSIGFGLALTFKLPSSVTSRRLWIGLTSATMTDSDTAPGHFVGVRYSTVAGDAGFMPASRDGTTQTIGAAGSAPVADVPYMLVMSGATGGSSVRVLVYRLDTSATVLDATITATLPGSTTDTDWMLYCHGQGSSRAVEISQVVRLIDVT